MTMTTSHDDAGQPWLVIGLLVLATLLLIVALFLWRYRPPGSSIVSVVTTPTATVGVVRPKAGASPTRPGEVVMSPVASPAQAATAPKSTPTPAPMTPVTEPKEAAPAVTIVTATPRVAAPTPSSTSEATEATPGRVVVGGGIIEGQLSLQGRSIHAGVTILLDGTPVATTGDQGRFRIPAVPAGTYTVTARYPGYIPRQAEAVPVQVEGTTTLPPVSLHGGDTDNDGDVDVYDIVRCTNNFNQTVPAADPHADANGDGVIDLRDIIVIQGNFRRVGPEPWGGDH